jgi:hypothetical protein
MGVLFTRRVPRWLGVFLQVRVDLKTWSAVQTNTSPYLWYPNFSMTDTPQAFFRAKQER